MNFLFSGNWILNFANYIPSGDWTLSLTNNCTCQSVRYFAMCPLVIFQRENTSEILAAFHAVKITLLVTLPMLVEQILTREGLVADRTSELVGIHVQHVMPRQVVQPRVLLGTNVTGELGPLRVTSLMILQISLLGESFFTGAAGDLVVIVLFHIHMTCQFLARRELLFAEKADKFLRLLVPLYIFQKVWIGHDLVEKRIFQFIFWFGGGTWRDIISVIGSILCWQIHGLYVIVVIISERYTGGWGQSHFIAQTGGRHNWNQNIWRWCVRLLNIIFKKLNKHAY